MKMSTLLLKHLRRPHGHNTSDFFRKGSRKQKIGGFASLLQRSKSCQNEMDAAYPLAFPETEPSFIRSTNVDILAERLKLDAPNCDRRSALLTAADGSCLSLALSSAVYGNDSFHTEIRVRIPCELAINKTKYLSPDAVSRGTNLDGCYCTTCQGTSLG